MFGPQLFSKWSQFTYNSLLCPLSMGENCLLNGRKSALNSLLGGAHLGHNCVPNGLFKELCFRAMSTFRHKHQNLAQTTSPHVFVVEIILQLKPTLH
jgi:hypothetical protein